jgi:uncharacterized repeat protein (TIGR03803 family)
VAYAQTFRVLHRFNGNDGASPSGGLVLCGDAVCGATGGGGPDNNGTIFRINQAGEMAVHILKYPHGVQPIGELTIDSTGAIYVVMRYGGEYGFGTITRFDKSGTPTVLHSFAGPPTDGSYLVEGLTRDAAGNLFGTTFFGGAGNCDLGCGITYKLDGAGHETILHTFVPSSDGIWPDSPLLRDAEGRLFGTDSGGYNNAGVVFALSPTGVFDALYRFPYSGVDGDEPAGNLIRDSAGTLYGTTIHGGRFNYGTVFKLDRAGHETVLYSFHGDQDGGYPTAGVIRDAAGNLYGTASIGGSSPADNGGNGTVFKLDSAGHLTVLHTFTGMDGSYPEAPLLCYETNLYGTTGGGGDFGRGVVFELAGACGPL